MSTNLVYSYEYGYAALMQQVAKSEISKNGEGLILFKFYKQNVIEVKVKVKCDYGEKELALVQKANKI